MTPSINSDYQSSSLLATLIEIVFEGIDIFKVALKAKVFLRPWDKSKCRSKW